MGAKFPTTLLRRPSSLTSTTSTIPTPTSPCSHLQVRHATFIPRHRRPYTFTQLVQLSDGSTYTQRTTSPQALYRSTKDSRNHILWQPSDRSLRNVEVDEAGKLAAFRARFGRGWDAEADIEDVEAGGTKDGEKRLDGQQKQEEELMDGDVFANLISGYAAQGEAAGKKAGGVSARENARMAKAAEKAKKRR